MAQRDRAAVDVEPIGIDRELFQDGEDLRASARSVRSGRFDPA
jgi:hypothetical protein